MKVAIVDFAVWQDFRPLNNFPVLPISLVNSSVCFFKFTLTLWIPVVKFALISVSIWIDQSAILDLTILPETVDNPVVVKCHLAFAMRNELPFLGFVCTHLASVSVSVIQLIVFHVYELLAHVEVLISLKDVFFFGDVRNLVRLILSAFDSCGRQIVILGRSWSLYFSPRRLDLTHVTLKSLLIA